MSNEPKDLERRLEQATAPADAPDVPLDAETASLREAWLAFGQVLEAAQPAPDEPLPLRIPVVRRDSRGHWWLAGSLALAASLLVMATAAWSLFFSGGLPGRTSSPAGVAQSEPSHVEQLEGIAVESGMPAAPSRPSTLPPAPTPDARVIAENDAAVDLATDELAWDDPIDEEIVLTGQVMVSIQQDWYDVDQAYGSVYQGLQQVEEDIESGTL